MSLDAFNKTLKETSYPRFGLLMSWFDVYFNFYLSFNCDFVNLYF